MDLSGAYLFNKTSLLCAIFHALEVHKGIRFLNLDIDLTDEDPESDSEDNFDYSSLQRLLSRNRNITVLNYSGKKITNGLRIDKVYALNQFFHESASLMKESAALKPTLVTSALLNSSSQNFPYTGVMLSNHTDVLCELMQDLQNGAAVELVMEDATTSASISSVSDRNDDDSKRKPTRQLSPPDAKKAARDER